MTCNLQGNLFVMGINAIFIVIGLASQITACGQKGDLVLPETEQAEKAKKQTSHLYQPKSDRLPVLFQGE